MRDISRLDLSINLTIYIGGNFGNGPPADSYTLFLKYIDKNVILGASFLIIVGFIIHMPVYLMWGVGFLCCRGDCALEPILLILKNHS